jgi:hypothetical protein
LKERLTSLWYGVDLYELPAYGTTEYRRTS